MMVPLDVAAAKHVQSWLGPVESPGLLALHHALAYQRPGLWGDAPGTPGAVVLVREGHGGLEAFGAGRPEPAVGWLIGRRREFTLHAPEDWLEAVRERLGAVELDRIETWAGPGLSGPSLPPERRPRASLRPGAPASAGRPEPGPSTPAASSPRAPTAGALLAGPTTRRLADSDVGAVLATLPTWALRGWRSFPALLEHGAGFGVPHGAGFAALAWVFDRAGPYDAMGVFTVPRFRRLGLGRAVARALIQHIVRDRGRIPLWSTSPENEPSRGLARSMGFSVETEEAIVRWPPRGVLET